MVKNFDGIGENIWLHDNVELGDSVSIGHGSCIGYTTERNTTKKIIIGNNVIIGALCVIELGVELGNDVFVDHFCRIGRESKLKTAFNLFFVSKAGKSTTSTVCL